jgi:arginine exporter protein ArgO
MTIFACFIVAYVLASWVWGFRELCAIHASLKAVGSKLLHQDWINALLYPVMLPVLLALWVMGMTDKQNR